MFFLKHSVSDLSYYILFLHGNITHWYQSVLALIPVLV